MSKSSNWESTIKPIVVLGVISLIASLLQERYGFAYGMTGTLLSLMSVGNLLACLLYTSRCV